MSQSFLLLPHMNFEHLNPGNDQVNNQFDHCLITNSHFKVAAKINNGELQHALDIKTKMQCQFLKGVLDLDGMSFLLDVLHIDDCYVLGGYHDLDAFFFLIDKHFRSKENSYFRCQLIIRDYEPHFLTGDLQLQKLGNQINCSLLIVDSTPDDFSKNNAHKYHNLAKKHFNCPNLATVMKGEGVLTFTNIDKLQMDDFSCKVFSINFAKRLSKMESLHEYLSTLKNSTMISSHGVHLLAIHQLPPKLIYDLQSLSRFEKYLATTQFNTTKLRHHMTQHIEINHQYIDKKEQSVGGKPQNRSIDHKLNKYRHLIYDLISKEEHWKLTSRVSQSLISRSGRSFFNDQTIIKSQKNYSLTKDGNIVNVQIPFIEIPIPAESPFPENLTTIFFRKYPETDYLVSCPWNRYHKILSDCHSLTDTWIDVNKYSLNYTINKNGANISGKLEDILTFVTETLNELEDNPCRLLSLGLSQPLATFILLTSIKRQL